MGAPTLNTGVPANLPVAMPQAPIGYEAAIAANETETVSGTVPDAVSVVSDTDTDTDVADLTDLENHAHQNHVLLSSDAMRYLAGSVPAAEQLALLDQVIAQAKTNFPSDDGWVVMNLSRMEHLLSEVGDQMPEVANQNPTAVLAATPTTPMQAGSLAEAIVMGNVAAAYQLIEHRPMVALADAAADLDAVFRDRQGETVAISDVLRTHTARLSIAQVRAAIVALTSALDGTYSSEAEAVKMAILKAVKAIS